VADWLPGSDGNPVRIGNAAAKQFQLDVYGEVLDALHQARRSGLKRDDPSWTLQVKLMEYVAAHWTEPDEGIWEIRGKSRNFTHSKLMAWVAADRAVKAVEDFGLAGPAKRWRALREVIRGDIMAHGFDAERGTFTQFYGSRGLDAALLLIPQVEFLPWDDPRVAGTVHAVAKELTEDGFVLRYRPDADGNVDGLPGAEGAFLACTFWLADALCGIGERAQAEELFERLLGLRNDLGMLSEEYDPDAKRQLGNTPQAFSHVGLVNTARHLSGSPIARVQL
jgi:GH15 family glucan-1,4-alpha-glucosidase